MTGAADAYPGVNWESDPALLGSSGAAVETAVARGRRRSAAALMVVAGGKVVAASGDLTERVDIASARKSLVSALYGIYIGEGVIDPSSTLGDLGIDDIEPLTDTEKRATIRDLLMARSGVYRVAASEGLPMKLKRPRRGSHAPGEHWYYNNFDFNVLGTILEQSLGASVHEVFEQRIARPLGMQDYRAADGWYRTTKHSTHRAYRLIVSARDMARFGLLYARHGRWRDQQIVPEEWVKESTLAHTPLAKGGFGYGYTWWIGNPAQLSGCDFYLARGGAGHAIVVVPDLDVVVVHRIRSSALGRRLRLPFLTGWLGWIRVGPRPRRVLPPTTLNAVLDAVVAARS